MELPVLATPINPEVLFTDHNAVDGMLEEITKAAMSHVPVLETAQGRKDIAAMAYKVKRSKTFLDGAGKEITSVWKQKAKGVDAIRKKIRDTLDGVAKEVRQPLTDWEQAEEDRQQAHVDGIANIERMASLERTGGVEATGLMEIMAELKSININDTWEEYKDQALSAQASAMKSLEKSISDRIDYEAEQVELKALREAQAAQAKKDYDAKIAKEAADRARKEAEEKAELEKKAAEQKLIDAKVAAERARKEAEEKAEQEKKAAEQKLIDAKVAAERAEQAKADAERRAIEAESRAKAKAEADRLETERKAKADADRRAADIDHRKKINNEALSDFEANGIDQDTAKTVISLIAKGLIRNIIIKY